MKILLVDNAPVQRATLEQRLRAMGIEEVLHAGCSGSAMEWVAKDQHGIDLIIANIQLEPVDGIGLMRQLATSPATGRPALALVGDLDKTAERAIHSLARALNYPLAGSIGNPLHSSGLAHIFENLAASRPADLAGTLSPPLDNPALPAFGIDDILRGLNDDQFEPAFQPKINASSKNLYGVEALARWRHPEFGTIDPRYFIPALEQHGEIHRLTDVMVDKTIAALARFIEHGIETCASINLSPTGLEQYALVERLCELTRRHGIKNHCVTLELTETATIRDTATTLETLSRLRMHGFGLALGNFGAGHSSLQNLDILPASEIKIDPTYVADIQRNSIHRKMLKSFVDLGRHVGANVVAEGVETRPQSQYLSQIGCTALQGYFIAAPMSAEQLMLSYGSVAA